MKNRGDNIIIEMRFRDMDPNSTTYNQLIDPDSIATTYIYKPDKTLADTITPDQWVKQATGKYRLTWKIPTDAPYGRWTLNSGASGAYTEIEPCYFDVVEKLGD